MSQWQVFLPEKYLTIEINLISLHTKNGYARKS